MKKIILICLLISMSASTYSQDSLARAVISEKQGDDIVTHIRFLQRHTKNAEEEIKAYVNSLQPVIPVEDIALYYLTKFQLACDAKDPQSILFNSKIYLALGQEEDLAEVYISAAKAATAIGDDSTATVFLEKLKSYSKENEGWYDEEIAGLTAEMDDIQHERIKMQRWSNWNEGIKGTWINRFGSSIITINNPATSSGATLILDDTKIRLKRVHGKRIVKVIPKELNLSQNIQFDGPNKAISIQFASQKIRDRGWLQGISQTGLELSRTIRTETNTYIRTSNTKPKNKVRETYITNTTTDLLNELFTVMTISSREEKFYSFSMGAITENRMDASCFYSYLHIYSDGRNYSYDGNHDETYVRWDEEDSAFLILKNGKPFFVGSIEPDNPMLQEYKRIKQYNSFFNPRFLLPTVVSIGLGGGMVYESVYLFREGLSKNFVSYKPFALFIVGTIFLFIPTSSIIHESGSGIDKGVNLVLYRDFNSRNMKNVWKKHRTDLSFAPTYTPEHNALGAAVNVSF